MLGKVTLTKFAIITLSRFKGDHRSDDKIRDQIRKAIAANPLLKGWKVSKIAIISD